MNRYATDRVLRLAVLLLCIGLAGCATTDAKKTATSNRIYFPEAPAAPRLQFLLSFSDARAFTEAGKSNFSDWIVGTSPNDATSTRINGPYCLAVYHGKLYITDVAAKKIHIIDVAAKQYAVLGAPEQVLNPVNIVIDADGTKYVCDTGKRMVQVFDANDKFVREIGQSERCSPRALAIVGQELYVCNEVNGTIEVWDRAGQLRRTFGRKGTGPDEFTTPTQIAVGKDGRLYITDMFLAMVKIFDTTGRFVGTIGMPGDVVGSFARPKGIAIDPKGLIYVTDAQWSVVQIFQPDGQLLLAFGAPGGDPSSLGMPAGVTIDASSLELFRSYIDPQFNAEYLVFVVNQFGTVKISLFAYGKAKNVDPKAYEIDMEQVKKAREALLAKQKAEEADKARKGEATPQPTPP